METLLEEPRPSRRRAAEERKRERWRRRGSG